MDPDPESNIVRDDSFTGYTIGEIHATAELQPDLQFYDDGCIKTFSSTSLLSNTENMIISSAVFDEDYNLITGEVSIVELTSDEFKSMIAHQEELSAFGKILKPRKSATLTSTCDKSKSFPQQYQKTMYKEVNGVTSPLGLSLGTFNAFAINDKHLRSITDRMNNFLVNCGTMHGLPVEAFKEIEAVMTATKKEPQHVAKIYSFNALPKLNKENKKFA